MEKYYCKFCNKNIVIRKGKILRCPICGYFSLTSKLSESEILKKQIKLTTFCTFCLKMVRSIPIDLVIQSIYQRTKHEIKLFKSQNKLGQEQNSIIATLLKKLKSVLSHLFQLKKNFDYICSLCYHAIRLDSKKFLKNQENNCPFCETLIDTDSTFCKHCGAKIKANTRHIPKKIKKEVWERDNGSCVNCGRVVDLQFDHIIPFSKGGANSVANLQILCSRCNKKKSDKVNG